METVYIIAINGLVSATFSFIAYKQSNKKSRNDFLNTQLSKLEEKVSNIRIITYKLHADIFDKKLSLDDNMSYRELSIENDDLLNQILAHNEFSSLQNITTEYNIFSGNMIEATDKETSLAIATEFDNLYLEFKKKINLLKDEIN